MVKTSVVAWFIRLLNKVGSRCLTIPLKIRGIKGVMSVSRLRFDCLFITPFSPLTLRGEPQMGIEIHARKLSSAPQNLHFEPSSPTTSVS